MSEQPAVISMDEDERYALAARAQSAEQSNRPRWMVIGAVVLLIVAGVYALTAQASRAGAERDRRNAASQLRAVRAELAKIETLRNTPIDANAPVPIGERLPNLLSGLASAARRSGIGAELPVPAERDHATFGSLVGKRYDYTIFDPDVGALLRFLAAAVEETPALLIHSVSLRPQNDRWQMIVSFLRWERPS
ncbi:MAG: hypothetical protein AAF138_02855 [Planctomycetota bacterium]